MTSHKGRWTRDGRRLQRISTMLDENVLKDDDLVLLKTDATNAIERLIVQHKIPVKPNFRKKLKKLGSDQNSKLLSLPLEIFVAITTQIDVSDVENLARTCKDMNMLVNRTFITRVVLPLSVMNMEKLGGRNGRYVLSLSSNANIRLWNKGEFECMLKSINLKYLKEVKFVGNNYGVMSGGGLISGYKSIMKNIFLSKKYVRKMDISVDSSEEYYKLLERLKDMPYLEELCLRSAGFRAQFNKIMPEGRTLNQVLENTLKGLKIKSLELKGFTTPWEAYSGYLQSFGVEIYSESIEVLKLQYSKNFELRAIAAEKLKEIKIVSDYFSFCLYHAQSCENGWHVYEENDPPGRLAAILANGCPNLELYNGVDLNKMRTISEDGTWLKELEHHKGEGIDSDMARHCSQCGYYKRETEKRIKELQEKDNVKKEEESDDDEEEESNNEEEEESDNEDEEESDDDEEYDEEAD